MWPAEQYGMVVPRPEVLEKKWLGFSAWESSVIIGLASIQYRVDRDMKGNRLLQTIENANGLVGKIAGFTYVVIMLIQIMDAILRYIFNRPTNWAWDINAQLFIGASILGGGYVLLHDSHIRVDLLYNRVNAKTKAVFDLISFSLTTLALALLTWQLGEMAWESWQIKEHGLTFFSPPVYPIKTLFFAAGVLLLLQAICVTYRRFESFKDAYHN